MAGINDVLWAGINTDGSVNAAATPDNTSKSTKGTSTLGKDAFLNLLVAQMKYQDPLNPTSDTEWISQMATFSTLEEMQNMNTTLGNSQALSLVGKTVIMNSDSAMVGGKVDYVVMQAGKAYLAVNDSLYSIDELDTVADEAYLEKLKSEGKLDEDVEESDTEKILKALESVLGKLDTMGSSMDKTADSISKAAEELVSAVEGLAGIGSSDEADKAEADKTAQGDKTTEVDKTAEADKTTEADKAAAESGETAETDKEAEAGAAETGEIVGAGTTAQEGETAEAGTTQEAALETVTTE